MIQETLKTAQQGYGVVAAPLTLEVRSRQGGAPEYLHLPASSWQMERTFLRAGVTDLAEAQIYLASDGLPEKVSARLHLEQESLEDLNAMCRAIQQLPASQEDRLNAVVCAVQPDRAGEVQRLAEELRQFVFVPNVHTAEEYGRHLVQESGKFAYDPDLADLYDYARCGQEQIQEEGGLFTAYGYVAYQGPVPLMELMRDEQQYQQGPQMGGMV